jgi:hypothetical protein
MDSSDSKSARRIGITLIIFAIAFNVPYVWLAATFDYPAILRSPPGVVLEAFANGGAPLVLTWAGFSLAALLFAPIAIAVASVTGPRGRRSSGIAALGIAAGVTQAIGLSRWVYAVPGLSASWVASTDRDARAAIETVFATLHQFAGVGIGEAIGQSLTAFWLIGVSMEQRSHPRFGRGIANLGLAGGVVLLLGLVEGLATAIPFDPGVFGFAGLVGFLLLTIWMIWAGVLCVLQPAAIAQHQNDL